MGKFLNEYKEDKKVRDLIKQRTFNSKEVVDGWNWNNHDLEFKITHVKEGKYYDQVYVNVKVCGKLRGWGWTRDKDGMCNVTNDRNFRSSISRNRDIRNHVSKSVASYLRLFGVEKWKVEVKKVTVVDSL